MDITVSKSKFKPQALEYFRRVQETGEPLVITEHGRPVLQIVPYGGAGSPLAERTRLALAALRGSVTRYDDPCAPVGIEDWGSLR